MFKLDGKLILLGDANVGKTHLLHRFIKNKLPANPAPTIGVEFELANIKLKNGQELSFTLWDTAGQEKFRSVTRSHYRRAIGCFLVYDITSHTSYLNINEWLNELKISADPDICIVLIGNKKDLADINNQRKVDYNEAFEFANNNSLIFLETSALTGENVQEAFQTMAEVVFEKQKKLKERRSNNSTSVTYKYSKQLVKEDCSSGSNNYVVCCGFKIERMI